MPAVVAAAVAASSATAFTVAGYAVTYGALAKVAFIAGSVAYSSSQSSKLRRSLATSSLDQGRTVMVRDPIAPQRLIYGQVLVSGTIVYMQTTGTKNEYLHLVIALAGHECHEIGDIYFGSEVVPLDGSGLPTSGRFVGHARVKKFLGIAAGERDTDLESESGGVWTSAHLGKGIARLHVRLKWSADVFANGMPAIKALVKGKKVYDFRTATTAWSANSALCAADYLMDSKFGRGVAQARIRSADVEEAANICDEAVVLADTTTEDRYTTNGTVLSAQDPGAVLLDLAGAMAGHIVDTGGTWTIRAGAHRASSLTLTDDDLVGPFSMQPRQSRQDTCNRVRGVYVSPQNQWAPADFPAVPNSTYKAKDGGIWLDRDLQFNFTTSPATAQRLAKIDLERSRQQITVTAPYNLKAMQVMPGDTVAITRARLGWTEKLFEVVEWAFKPTGSEDAPALAIELSLRETAAGVWDWNDGEETTVDLAPNTDLPDPFSVAAPTSLSVTNSVQQQSDGTAVPRLQVSWTAPQDIHVESGGLVRVEYKLAAASDYLPATTVRGDTTLAFILAVIIGQSYVVRVRAENNLGVASSWVTHTAVTVTGDTSAPASPSGLAAVVGTGKSVSLDWNDNTDDDLSEYGVYRSLDNVTFAKIAEVRASRFVDVDVSLGTTYYYRVTAIDTSENESAASGSVSAVPTTVGSGSVDATAPSTPSAPTYVSESTYLSGDGTVFARITIAAPALPSGGKLNQVLYRRSGASAWLIADELSASGNATVDDLSPGVAYEFAIRAISFSNVPSAVSTTLSRTAPNTTTAPSTPNIETINHELVPPKFTSAGVRRFAFAVWWNGPASPYSYPADFSHFEIKATATDSDGATDYNFDDGGTANVYRTEERIFHFYRDSAQTTHVRVRAVNKTGVASAWDVVNNILGTDQRQPGGGMMEQESDNVQSTGIKTGNGSSVRQVRTVFDANEVFTLSGGSWYESVNLSLTNRGFATIPDVGVCLVVDPPGDLDVFFDWTHGSNSSTNAVLTFVSRDHSTNISAGARRVHVMLTEYN